jgi:hypothetical protein
MDVMCFYQFHVQSLGHSAGTRLAQRRLLDGTVDEQAGEAYCATIQDSPNRTQYSI